MSRMASNGMPHEHSIFCVHISPAAVLKLAKPSMWCLMCLVQESSIVVVDIMSCFSFNTQPLRNPGMTQKKQSAWKKKFSMIS
jgi:hypothetical protein